jgi:hypothetical protein
VLPERSPPLSLSPASIFGHVSTGRFKQEVVK